MVMASEGQWTPNRLGGEYEGRSPSTLRPRAPWGWFCGWVPSHGWCSEAPRRAKRGGRRGDLRKKEAGSIISVTDLDKSKQGDLLKKAEAEASKSEISDQAKYLADQKVEVLRSIN